MYHNQIFHYSPLYDFMVAKFLLYVSAKMYQNEPKKTQVSDTVLSHE